MKQLLFRGQVVCFAPGTDDAYHEFIRTAKEEENIADIQIVKTDEYGRSLGKIIHKDDSTGYAIIDNENHLVVGLFSDTLKELRKLVNSENIWKYQYGGLLRRKENDKNDR